MDNLFIMLGNPDRPAKDEKTNPEDVVEEDDDDDDDEEDEDDEEESADLPPEKS